MGFRVWGSRGCWGFGSLGDRGLRAWGLGFREFRRERALGFGVCEGLRVLRFRVIYRLWGLRV